MPSKKLVGAEKAIAGRVLEDLSKYGIKSFQYGRRTVHKVNDTIVETHSRGQAGKGMIEEFKKIRDFCIGREGRCLNCPINMEPGTNSACIFMYIPMKWKMSKLRHALTIINTLDKKIP